ncbi:hypothetical protein BGZ74_001005 [Mortierella antarctica]|nr:hypothetical protein BGZ74_001005 [Mortierella antarctica]
MSSLTIGNFIGAGGYGSVYHARWATRRVAIKKFYVTQAEAKEEDSIRREIQLLERLRDKHIILFYGTTYHEDRLVLVMEYAEGGSLQVAIKKKRLLGWPAKTRIAQEIVRGLAYIHHENIIHRDLKSLNVLLTRHMEVKICDFGLATVKTTSASKSSGDSALKGTLRWMAPELFAKRPNYTTKSDMYALGMVMWEMAANCTLPFKDTLDNAMVVFLITKGEREDLPDDTPADYRKCVEQCWEQDTAMRPEAPEMITEDDEPEPGEMSKVIPKESISEVTFSSSSSKNIVIVSGSVATSMENTTSPSLFQPDAQQSNQVMDAFSLLLSRAEKDDVEAQIALAERYDKGDGIEQSYVEAFKWYLQAAKLGSTSAQFNVGLRIFHGQGVEQSHIKAVLWFHKSTEQGSAVGQHSLGMMYMNGWGVEQSHIKAVLWFHKSAEQGSADGQHKLGRMYLNGWGVEWSHIKAVLWFRKSAEQGSADGQHNLGGMYVQGWGVKQSHIEAVSWFRKSAEQGSADGQHKLGAMYVQGWGVELSHIEAVSWFRKSAEQGSAVRQDSLGRMYVIN